MKILVKVNIDRPLLRGAKIQYNSKEVWTKFKYENMALFYFYCRKVAHSKRNCVGRKSDARGGQILEGQYGEWLRANLSRVGIKQANQREMDKIAMESSKENVGRRTLSKKGREYKEGILDILIGLGVELENSCKEVAKKEKDLRGSETGMNKGPE